MHIYMSRFSRSAAVAIALSVAAVAGPSALVSSASASSDSLNVSGPTSNLMGANFNETISGVASGPANYVAAWEQFYKHTGCATTFAEESIRAFSASTWGLTAWLGRSVNAGHYSVLAQFGARNPGTHGMCAYLINASTGATYAHGSIWWNNHN